MDENVEKSVKDLINVFESVSQNSDKDEGRLKSDGNSDGGLKASSVSKYREQLQKELEELLRMRIQQDNNQVSIISEHRENIDETTDSGSEEDKEMKEDNLTFKTPFVRSKVLYSNSTISGARAKRRKRSQARMTFIDNVGIVCDASHAEALKSKSREDKLGKVLQEIVSSEKVYVRRLSVLNDSFRSELSTLNRKEYFVQWDTWDQMFSNLSNIHKFHSEYLLPRLEACLESHFSDSDQPKLYIGKVFSDLGPYLKMYSEYAQNYKRCLEFLDTAASQSTVLQQFITHFEARDICEGLKIRYFYIEPIQRLPRYELLLREYTSCLSDDSEDLVNAHIALKLVKQANIHSNDSIKNEENFIKIRQIEDSLRDSIDLSSVPRKFLREGNVDIVVPICGRIEERRMFLFSDLLLICQYYPHPFRPPYCVTEKLDITRFQVKEVRDRLFLFGPNTIIELLPKSSEDRKVWKEDLDSVAKNKESERFSLVPNSPLVDRLKQPSLKKSASIKTRPLGLVAPIMMVEQGVQACMECSEEFGIFNRKRSCFACGRVICGSCAEHKEPLAYLNYHIRRVCNKCHDLLQATPNLPRMF